MSVFESKLSVVGTEGLWGEFVALSDIALTFLFAGAPLSLL